MVTSVSNIVNSIASTLGKDLWTDFFSSGLPQPQPYRNERADNAIHLLGRMVQRNVDLSFANIKLQNDSQVIDTRA
ncbi:MAG: hypothetical protein KKH94_04295 [Candidatus Omnitrophica bacterium]|nr:hypothetical protein [Candidatus Omnitrophota bacterium]